jgi:hypothetical protein
MRTPCRIPTAERPLPPCPVSPIWTFRTYLGALAYSIPGHPAGARRARSVRHRTGKTAAFTLPILERLAAVPQRPARFEGAGLSRNGGGRLAWSAKALEIAIVDVFGDMKTRDQIAAFDLNSTPPSRVLMLGRRRGHCSPRVPENGRALRSLDREDPMIMPASDVMGLVERGAAAAKTD